MGKVLRGRDGALFNDLVCYVIREPCGWKGAREGKDHISHQVGPPSKLRAAAPSHTCLPPDGEMQ
ncbi:protein of unknown function (plasmid) [Cupriavidus taiwanensis]|uniref:Uncharacterized protein n=1 Tax=Cupriavidus taiwanensis TaxID=164546 RepID=A0A375ECD0_9BURK|nr:hypothetical protein [Cupriavidus taiwanensis]SOZ71363.1 protein of unknown function [Cupriavidus taiwanensis]SOZ72419.1 protein of unknown function [Cupriavidus taiwanensis]SOZ74796.1 protein of unknown function [Cupriavidus taiwanensis]SPA03621.1 protein of unknown function [Cupriavidus taiwanensis]SPA11521.1 protein of unknown function [Cupriavidus taiwanensis]